MKQKLISIMICPNCRSSLELKVSSKIKGRIKNGKLLCKKCNSKFEIINDIVCFKKITPKDKNKKKIQKTQKMFLGQEFKKEWLRHFTKEELSSLNKEWKWMINEFNLSKSKIHLDWATGTGRFLRNILNIIKGEIIVMEIDYPTCLGLKTFLKKIGKYSKVTIVCGDARSMPFINNSIESASSWSGLDEPEMSKAISESKRVLKSNKRLSVSGLFFEKDSKSLKLAKKWKIEFAKKDKAFEYFKKLGFKDIQYKIFFEGKWTERGSFLPKFGDYYISYAISGKK